MGAVDTEGKLYLSQNKIFADAFNFLLYGGEQVIKADELKEMDTTQIAVPYGYNARLPVQKYRDLLKVWNAMMDDNLIYVILGGEIQDKAHYGMPVKDGLYDMIGYSKQIEEIRKSYKANTGKERQKPEPSQEEGNEGNDGTLLIENGTLKVKLTSTEFLSGLRKGDKLIPIITAVIYISPEPWDGPMSLFDMLEVKDERLYPFLNDYKLNIIAPANIGEDEFTKFHTDLGLAMKVLKHSRSKDVTDVILSTNHRKIDRGTAVFLNRVINLGLEYEEKEGDIDMCQGMEIKMKEEKVAGAIEGMRLMGATDNDIVEKIINSFDVTKEYVLALLAPKTA